MLLIRLLSLIVVATGIAACGGSSGGGGGSTGGGGSGGGGGGSGGAAGGLDARPANLTCVAPDRGATSADIELTPVFTSLGFDQPLAMYQAPGDGSRWFVLERGGRVRVFANDRSVSSFNADFINLPNVSTAGEGGLLGMAFHPSFASNGHVFLSWTEPGLISVVARFTSNDGGQTLDPGSRLDIIRADQPFSNHNGGMIAFGDDGYLYFGLGDGGGSGVRSQETTNLLGAMLRLDVDNAVSGDPYDIPADNPFAANPVCPADHSSATNCPEIYAWGFRNPWRWSFDRDTGELWVGDVGEASVEEVDRVELGGNYGWDCREGTEPFRLGCSAGMGFVEPLHAYTHGGAQRSINGGYVYRGSSIPGLFGHYVFGDFITGQIWQLVGDGSGGYVADELDSGGANTSFASAFAEGNDGELYLVHLSNNRILAIDPAAGSGGGGADPVATMLSDTGCFDSQNPALPAPGLIPYDVAAPFWSDGADKERWLAIPDGQVISVNVDGDFVFPTGTVLAKHFRLGGTLIETRLYMRHPDGVWAGYTYEWNATGTEAERVIGGKVASKSGQDWIYPAENECGSCHTPNAGSSLGLEVLQLNNDFTYAATGRTANQLATLDAIGLFASPFGDPSVHPALSDPSDASATSEARARSYLHANCAQCHRPSGPTTVSLDLRAPTALSNTGICAAPQAGDLGIAMPLIVAPGEPDRSVLVARVDTRNADAMPPLASGLVDTAAVAMLRDWVAGLATCP